VRSIASVEDLMRVQQVIAQQFPPRRWHDPSRRRGRAEPRVLLAARLRRSTFAHDQDVAAVASRRAIRQWWAIQKRDARSRGQSESHLEAGWGEGRASDLDAMKGGW